MRLFSGLTALCAGTPSHIQYRFRLVDELIRCCRGAMWQKSLKPVISGERTNP